MPVLDEHIAPDQAHPMYQWDKVTYYSAPHPDYVYEPSADASGHWVIARIKSDDASAMETSAAEADEVQAIRDAARDQAASTGDAARTALYRLRDAESRLLYAGISSKPPRRWVQHAADKKWWPEVAAISVEWFDSRTEALAIEAHVIRLEQPVHNVTHKSATAGQQRGEASAAPSLMIREVRGARWGSRDPFRDAQ